MRGLTHLDEKGSLRMVDVTEKPVTEREALAKGEIKIKRETIRLILDRKMPKGNVLEAARLAGIMAAKRTGDLIPLCHPLNITGVEIDFNVQEEKIEVESKVRIPGQTGVEMEALTATSMALLTIYDMCKAVDKEMVISNIRLIKKTGGRSGNDKSRNPNDKR